MQRVFNFIARMSDWGGIGSSACILLIITLILVEILVRSVSGRSIFIAEEFSGYLLCWFAFMGMSYTLKADGHIRVNLLISRVSARKKALLEILSGLVGLGAFLFLTAYLALLFYNSLVTGVRSMHVSEMPLFIPQIIPVLGSALMVLQFVAFLGQKVADLSVKDEELTRG
jgi:TRAP-type C4-dicarboxylate transport system permease small subunit